MQSKKANLVIDIAKNVVEQYREQLKKSIEENRYRDLSAYEHECVVERAENALVYVDKILENFEQSVFDGEITEKATYEAVYTSKGRELRELVYNGEPSLSNREFELALSGTRKIFKQIGIPEYSIYPIVADIMERTRDDRYTGGELDLKLVEIFNKKFNIDGKYNVGELYINNVLSINVRKDTGIIIDPNDDPVLYFQNRKLYLEADKIKNILDVYIEEEINERNLESLEKQNNFLHDTFNTVRHIGTIGDGGSTRDDYSLYYYDYFKSMDMRKEYYKVARPIESKKQTNDFALKKELQSLKQQKENLERLTQLTEEEKELNARLLEILEEKMRIAKEISGFKIEEQPVMDFENQDKKMNM